MSTLWRGSFVALALPLLFAPAFAQSTAVAPEDEAAGPPQWVTPSRVLAGLRGYADPVVEALARLAEHPDILQSAAEAIEAGREPALDATDIDPQVRDALGILTRSPGALLLAASCPDELHLLHSLWSVAPEGVALRLEQLRRAYEQAARTAAHDWQRALENDPVALGGYRDLLTRYCEAAREANPAFACVRVTDRRYYYACPPDEALVLYANEAGLPTSLYLALARWWEEHAPQHVDATVERTRVLTPAALDAGDFVYDWPAAERAPLWQPVEAGVGDRALGLVPVILQPPADQPPAARLAWAVTENARLWSPAMPAVAVQIPEAESRPAPDEEEPAVVVEEPIPGPQTARQAEPAYVDVPELERPAEVLPRYTGYYYGYPWATPYYCGPSYYYSRTPIFDPYSVYYSCDPYYLGGVYLRPGYLGVRAYGSCGAGRIHYGGGRHYGYPSVPTGRRSGYRPPQVYISTRSQGHPARAYRSPSGRPVLRDRSVHDRRTINHVRRSGPGTRAIHSGARTTGQRQAIGSRIGAIRGGSRPAHAGSSGRAIRSPSQTGGRPSGVRSHGGGVRRR
jgi:hypothetical protein